MSYQSEYQTKLMSAEEAIGLIAKRGNIGLGMAASEPPALLKALEQRLQKQTLEELKVYYMHSEEAAHNTILKYEYMNVIKPHPFYMGPIERDLTKQALTEQKKVIYYMPGNFSDVPRILTEYIKLDAFIVMVSPMDKAGFFSCGTNGDYTIPAGRASKNLIVEVNPNMPRVFGDCSFHISEIAAIVENKSALVELPAKPENELDRKIGETIVDMVDDRATVQFGIGGVPNAVCSALINHKDLGVHSELMGSGLAQLIQSGAVTNRYKNINKHKNVYTIALGDKAMYDFLDNNSSMECYSVDYVNDPYVISKNDRVVSINSFVEVDLTGQVNAEFLKGRQFSAPGGQLDFVRGSQLSKGGKSILTAYSTASGGKFSRIVPRIVGPTTDPRVDTQYIVTEYGAVNLRGKSTTERALALIEIAHPDFRAELTATAKKLGYI